MRGERRCSRCKVEYLYPFEGGHKYCLDCKGPALAELKESYKALSRKMHSGEVETANPPSRFFDDYMAEWACVTCGMKYNTRDEAFTCCSDACLDAEEPHHAEGGFVAWKSETHSIRKLEELSTIFPLESESTRRLIFSALVARDC